MGETEKKPPRRWVNVLTWGAMLMGLAILFSTLSTPPAALRLPGEPAPGLRLPLLGGGELDLAAHAGKEIVVLDFWATWCAPCRRSMPELDRIGVEYAARGVRVYFVNQGESVETIRRYVDATELRAPVALDERMEAGSAYFAEGIPQTVIVGLDGIVKHVEVGAGGVLDGSLREALDRLLQPD